MSRRRLAIVACLLWLAGVELLPAIHQAMHDELAPHTHDAGGMVVTVSFGDAPHRHADGTVHAHEQGFVARYARTRRRSDGKSRAGSTPGTHADGLAHHAVALQAPPPPLTKPLPIERRPMTVIPAAARVLVSATVPEAAARGPPRRAS